MQAVLPFIIIGLVNGTLFAVAAMGLTLTFKTTGVFNFAFGAISAAAAYFFYELHQQHEIGWPVAALLTLAVFGVGVGLLFERFGMVLQRVSTPLQIAATVGVMVGVQAIIILRYGAASVSLTNFLPVRVWEVGGTYVNATQVIVLCTTILLAIGLWALIRLTPLGLATRAVVDSPELLSLTGRNPTRARRGSWILGSSFAAISGVLSALIVGTLDPSLFTLLLVQAFGAAAFGGFRNLGLTFLGGVVLGLASSLTTYWVQGHLTLGGLPNAIPFIALLAALMVTPRARLGTARAPIPARRVRPAASSTARQAMTWVAGVAVLVAAPAVVGVSRLPSLTLAVALATLFLSLGLLVHFSGQVSLVQYSLAAVGAVAFSQFLDVDGMPWLVALLLAGLCAVPVGAAVALPAIRLSGLMLALATFAFGLVMQQLFYTSTWMFGGSFDLPTPRPDWAQDRVGYYAVVCGVSLVACALVVAVDKSRLGRLLRGMADSPTAISTNGASLTVMKFLVFCLSAFLAGIAGALIGPITGSITSTPFDPFNSLLLLTVLFLAGGGLARYAYVGGVAIALVPTYAQDPRFSPYLQVLFAVSVVMVAALAARSPSSRPWQTWVMSRLRPDPPLGRQSVTAPDEGLDQGPALTSTAEVLSGHEVGRQ